MEKSSIYFEMFGGDGLDESTVYQKPTPAVSAIDDPLFPYTPSDGSAAGLCRQLEDADLVSKLIGSPVDIPRRAAATIHATVPGSSALNRSLAALATIFVKQVTKPGAAKPSAKDTAARWDSAKHETTIRRLVNRTRSADVFESIRDADFDYLWDKLVQSCVDNVCSAVHEAAEEAA
jgi:hypothetical protein